MIKYNNITKTFVLSAAGFSYVFRVNQFGYLQSLHYGEPIGDDDLEYLHVPMERGFAPNIIGSVGRKHSLDLLLLEYPFFGSGDFRHGAILTKSDTGVRLEDLKYKSHRILSDKPAIPGMPSLRKGKSKTLRVTLASNAVEVDLYYSVYEQTNTITRRAEVKNLGYGTLSIERAASMSLDLHGMDYDMVTLWGAHCAERRIERTPLTHGIKSVYSLRGASSHHFNPFVALCSKSATENSGTVIGINYIYGGNFLISAECDYADNTRIYVGFPEFDFGWQLAKGEVFCTPETVLVFGQEGLGGMSRSFHDLYRENLIDPNFVRKPRPVVINNWEATYFDFDDDKLCKIIDSAAELGIDTFVLDDGWFGKRDSDTTGLGDWFVNRDKLPNGLRTVIDRCKKHGMNFGLWFEPEMISEDSELFRKHPDWRLSVPGVQPASSREQYVLDLSRKDVVDYLKKSVGDILSEHSITYVKWDFNRNITDAYSAALPPSKQQEVLHRYMLGLYELIDYLTKTFPDVLFEGCSGGGGRFDPSMLRYFPQYWTSDNTDAWARAFIQEGTSYCYPPSSMIGHVSVCPNHQTGRNTPLEARGIMASMCAFGYELDHSLMTDDEKLIVSKQVEFYNNVASPLVLSGDLYRLKSPAADGCFGWLIMAKDKQHGLIAYMQGPSECHSAQGRMRLHGLDPRKTYRINKVDFSANGEHPTHKGQLTTPVEISGKTLITLGIPLPIMNIDFGAIMYLIEAV